MMTPSAAKRRTRFLFRVPAGAGTLLVVVALCGVAGLHVRDVSEKEAIDKLRPVTRLKAKEGRHPVRVWLRRRIPNRDPYWLALPVTRIELVGPRDEHLGYLKALRDLRTLTISDPEATEGGFARVDGLRALTSLTLTGEQVTDASLRCLGRLPRLRSLDLQGTGISDVGLLHLKKFPKLQAVNLQDTGVTPDGLRKLREALPGIRTTQ